MDFVLMLYSICIMSTLLIVLINIYPWPMLYQMLNALINVWRAAWVLGSGSAAQVSQCRLGGFLSFGSFARALPRRSLSGCTLRERRGFPFHAPRVRLLQEF